MLQAVTTSSVASEMGPRRNGPEDRFLAKVERIPFHSCWEWTGGFFKVKGKQTYGAFDYEDRLQPAHRVSYQMYRGAIPAGLFVLHRCDNMPCVNPEHLFLGTQKDNMQDMVRKGRKFLTVGAYKSNSKLTEAQVGHYRRRHIAGESVRSLARGIEINPRSLFDALHGATWKHLTATEDQPCVQKHKQRLAGNEPASRQDLS